jgi:hypothetical protein
VRRHDQHLSSEAYANTAVAQFIYRNRASAVHRGDTQGVHIRAQPFKEHGSPERAQEQELGAYVVRGLNSCGETKHHPSRCINFAMQERQGCVQCELKVAVQRSVWAKQKATLSPCMSPSPEPPSHTQRVYVADVADCTSSNTPAQPTVSNAASGL